MRKETIAATLIVSFIFASLTFSVESSEIPYRRVTGEERVFQHLFGSSQFELSTFPFCIAEETAATNIGDNSDDALITANEADLTPDKYYEFLITRNLSALNVEIRFAIIKLASVIERDQMVTLDIRTETEWTDCRLSWSPQTFGMVKNISIPPERFRSIGLFVPAVFLREETNQQASISSEVQVVVHASGRISIAREYSTSIACDLDLMMYPFDHHACHFTFETGYSSLDVNLTYQIADSVDEESWKLLARNRYKPNKLWELVVLPARKSRRLSCAMAKTSSHHDSLEEEDADAEIKDAPMHCLVDRQIFRIILARHPTYQVINLFTPAFLCMIVSASIYIIPNGASDKTFLMLCILLSTFWFAISIYEKMPDNGSSVSWMGIYYFLCISVVSFNCIICAISVTISSAKVGVPRRVRSFVLFCAPALLRDLISLPRHRHTVNGRFIEKNNRNDTNASENSNEMKHDKRKIKSKANSNHNRVVQNSDNLTDSYRIRGEGVVNGLNLSEVDVDADVDVDVDGDVDDDHNCGCEITWLHVSTCLDRIYFILLLAFSICTLLVFIVGGYIQPESYYASHLKGTDWQYVASQLEAHEDSDILKKIASK